MSLKLTSNPQTRCRGHRSNHDRLCRPSLANFATGVLTTESSISHRVQGAGFNQGFMSCEEGEEVQNSGRVKK